MGTNQLGVKQVDLYLIHQPGLVRDNLESAWKDFEQIKDDGLSK